MKILLHVINTPSEPWKAQHFLVIDEMPKILFERVGSYLIGEKDGVHQCYGLSGGVGSGAFANREFDIPMKDGSVTKAQGQWWDCVYPEWKDKDFYTHGINTMDKLRDCFVFFGGYLIAREVVDEFMKSIKDAPTLYRELENKLRHERMALHEFKRSFKDDCEKLLVGELPCSEKWLGFYSAYTLVKKESNVWRDKYFIASSFVNLVSDLPTSQEDIDNAEEEMGAQAPFDEIDFEGEYIALVEKAGNCRGKISAVKSE